jgi:hypothetical protein
MTQVAAAFSANHFGSNHSVRAIFDQLDRVIFLRLIKTWPTAVSVELGFALEEFGSAAFARERSEPVLVEQFACVSTLGALFAQNVKLELGKFFTPLLVCFVYFEAHGYSFSQLT